MISLPPNEHDLHAYVDHQLSENDRRALDTWLATHPEVAAQVQMILLLSFKCRRRLQL